MKQVKTQHMGGIEQAPAERQKDAELTEEAFVGVGPIDITWLHHKSDIVKLQIRPAWNPLGSVLQSAHCCHASWEAAN